jgi:heat shock protein HtpX
MAARRRRRELFPPDRGLQARMVVTAVLTPAVVVALAVGVVAVAPARLLVGMVLATMLGIVVAVRARGQMDRARLLRPGERPELQATVERLCVLADLPRPEIAIVDERQPNSWIVDPPGRPPRLHLTKGLLEVLQGPELEAVVAHELAHVANRDATVMTVVGGPGAVMLEGGRMIGGRGGWWLLQFGGLVAGLIGLVSQVGTNLLSRHRELAADAGAAALTGRPAALAAALLKVSDGLARLPAEDLRVAAGRDAFHLLEVGRPDRHTAWGRLARSPLGRRVGATHPSLERRLAELERLERRMHSARPAAP